MKTIEKYLEKAIAALPVVEEVLTTLHRLVSRQNAKKTK